jgi:hypothetical protein
MNDKKCPICKTECEEMLIAETLSMTFEKFQKDKDFRKSLHVDKEDPNVYFETGKVKSAGIHLR